ncbi:hypothetical protein FKR81_14735 [Lentzea tibetensis]|uniref:Uncharacterized protein n=1 Tax=Lentzea tibetensis TaxID=2591470 RepID=A0A563EUW0_9PSEU|nr:hypothetical protein [Lentzea tibetensis]TWP51466.1 hypothetical protein FKR81_14735 [Lentzea tibetensis]
MCRAGGRRCTGSATSSRATQNARQQRSRARRALRNARGAGDDAAIAQAQQRLDTANAELKHHRENSVNSHDDKTPAHTGDVTPDGGQDSDVTDVQRERAAAIEASKTALDNGDGAAYAAALDRLAALPRETPPTRKSTASGDVVVTRFSGTTSGTVVQAGQVNGGITMSDHQGHGIGRAIVRGSGNVVSSGDIVNGRPVPTGDVTGSAISTGQASHGIQHDRPQHSQVVIGNGNTVSGHPNRSGSTAQVVRGNGNTVSGGRTMNTAGDAPHGRPQQLATTFDNGRIQHHVSGEMRGIQADVIDGGITFGPGGGFTIGNNAGQPKDVTPPPLQQHNRHQPTRTAETAAPQGNNSTGPVVITDDDGHSIVQAGHVNGGVWVNGRRVR